MLGPIVFSAQYFAAAWFTWMTSVAVTEWQDRMLWRGVSVLLIGLGINRTLEHFLIDMGRMVAREHGWYSQREVVQIWLILGVVMVCMAALAVLLVFARQCPVPTQLALVGMIGLLALALIKDVSLHQIDYLIAMRIFGLKINWLLEIGGIGWVHRKRMAPTPKTQNMKQEFDGLNVETCRSVLLTYQSRKQALVAGSEDRSFPQLHSI